MSATPERAFHLLYGRRWWANPLNWTYERRVLRPLRVANSARANVVFARMHRALAELATAVESIPAPVPTDEEAH